MSQSPPPADHHHQDRGLKDSAGKVVGAVKHGVGGVVHHGKEKIQGTDAYQFAAGHAKDFEHEQKRKIAALVYKKADKLFEHWMAIANDKTKDVVKDEYMPGFIQDLCDNLVDAWWPDVKFEVKNMILTAMSPPTNYHGEKPCCPCSPLALWRYWMLPYDRGFWRMIRNPFWWLWTIASLVPLYGATQGMFTLFFLFIDKGDSYQVEQFILRFKGTQFFSVGVFLCIHGLVQFYLCSAVPTKGPGGQPNCDEFAPQISFITGGLFVWQVVLVWIAFIVLQYSKSKGGDFYRMEKLDIDPLEDGVLTMHEALVEDSLMIEELQAVDADANWRSKKRLAKFLIYDLLIFILTLGMGAWLFYHLHDEPESEQWRFRGGLFVLMAFYGLMSFPFLALVVPGISQLISHSRPTGYNPYGNTVRYLGKEEDGPLPWAPDRPTKEQRIAREKEAKKKRREKAKAEKAQRKKLEKAGAPVTAVNVEGTLNQGGGVADPLLQQHQQLYSQKQEQYNAPSSPQPQWGNTSSTAGGGAQPHYHSTAATGQQGGATRLVPDNGQL